ncbi:MAG: ATP-binding protein, partial [Lachnospiraceae bacterium]|nr:ATP-binding protein [Lachnospiraceae bacterium]
TGIGMVVIIDEWDCIFRLNPNDDEAQKDYLDFLRDFLKDKPYISLAYMTGILPIKKYGVHSALNMFDEFSMTSPKQFDRFVGFTADEVRGLCDRYGMDFSEMSAWYDGYSFPRIPSVFNPRSVVAALSSQSYGNYWTRTETYEALKVYIDMDTDGLRKDIVRLLAGGQVTVDADKFTNDMVTFRSKGDVLTLLVHLGYLGYLGDSGEVFIPNREISGEFVTAMESPWYDGIAKAVKASLDLLRATWGGDAAAVAALVEEAHQETSHLTYNDENALAYTVSLAYYTARQYYSIIREMPSGKGYADMIFLPLRSHPDKPAMVVELKWNKSAQGAINQIKDKNYPAVLKGHTGQLLLVGINYDKDTKTHTCEIEDWQDR